MQITFKLKEGVEKIKAMSDKITLINHGFESLLEKEMEQEVKPRKVWICGPPKMNEGVSKFLR